MKGQVFILIAFVICVMIAGLGNIYTYSNLPSETEKTKISDMVDLMKNIHNEIDYVAAVNQSDNSTMNDFYLFALNFTEQKNYVANLTYFPG